MLKVINASMVR